MMVVEGPYSKARREAAEQFGKWDDANIRQATEEDVGHFLSMGGIIT